MVGFCIYRNEHSGLIKAAGQLRTFQGVSLLFSYMPYCDEVFSFSQCVRVKLSSLNINVFSHE